MWLKEALRVFTRLTAIKPPLQNHFVNTMYLNGYIKLKKENFRLGERFHTPVLDNTIKLPYLRTTPGTQKQKGKKDTLFKDREPQKPYPIPPHVPI